MILINEELLNHVTSEAQQSKRKRKNFNFHKQPSDLLQRMLNAFEPYTYVRPHKHENPDKREVFLVLIGKAAIVEFDDQGNIRSVNVLNHNIGVFGIEIPPGVYHTIISLEIGTVLYEIKDGPYIVENDKNFAEWAPVEGAAEAMTYLEELTKKLNLH